MAQLAYSLGALLLSTPQIRSTMCVWNASRSTQSTAQATSFAATLGLENVNAVTPEDVPADIAFRAIRSNPPIRVGKDQLHGLLETWIPRLDERSDAHLVVSRNLGSDSLQRWLAATFERGYSVHRVATGRGFRVIKVRRRGAAATGVIPLP